MIPLYILGLLQRFGPQHGYQIKKIIAEQLSDFTQIKLPTIYYHLEKMEADGLLDAASDKSGNRPEKTVYSITDKGIDAFHKMIEELLKFDYRPVFSSDGAFYFSDYIESGEIIKSLKDYIDRIEKIIGRIEAHRLETIKLVPEEARVTVDIIFSHHLQHYNAELRWAKESLSKLNGMEE